MSLADKMRKVFGLPPEAEADGLGPDATFDFEEDEEEIEEDEDLDDDDFDFDDEEEDDFEDLEEDEDEDIEDGPITYVGELEQVNRITVEVEAPDDDEAERLIGERYPGWEIADVYAK